MIFIYHTLVYKSSKLKQIMADVPSYRHDLGNGLYLDAFSLDPNLDKSKLRARIESLEGRGKPDIERLASVIDNIGYYNSLGEFGVQPIDQSYEIPEQLKAYRAALAQKLDIGRQFNGPIAIIQAPLQVPIKLFREGRYYDYQATAMDKVPAELLPQLLGYDAEELFMKRFVWANTPEKFKARYDSRLEDRFDAKTMEEFLRRKGLGEDAIERFKGKKVGELLRDNHDEFSRIFDIEVQQIEALQRANYPAGKSVRDIFAGSGLGIEHAARYLAFGFIMMPNNGREVSFVYRSPNVGIAADCMSISGSTPPFTPEIFKPGFNLGFYETAHLVDQMNHEYGLSKDEYKIAGMYAFDDKDAIPFLALKISAVPSAEEIAKRKFGDQRAVDEHPILFSLKPEALNVVVDRFHMWPSSSYVLHILGQDLK